MYPIIHDFKADNLESRGYGALIDCISCDVIEELNGGFTLEIKYPLHGVRAEYLLTGNIIMAKPSHNQPVQAFRINQVKESFNSSITVYANHISYDLSGYPLRSARSLNSLADVINVLNTANWDTGNASYHKFTFMSDIESNVRFNMSAIQTIRSWMGGQEGSIIDTYGGEWEYDNFTCYLRERRGADNGIRISYGRNLAEYEKQRNYTEYSHVCAVWQSSDFVYYSDITETGISSPFRVLYVDVSKDFENPPSTAELNASAKSKASQINQNSQTVTVTPAQIGGRIIGLGDTVYICYKDVFQTRVIKTDWDVLADKYKTFVLGTKQANITDTIKSLTSSNSTQFKSKQYSGTLNSYGCIQTDLKPEKIIIDAKTAVDPSFQCTPLIAGGWWWIRAVDWHTGNAGSGSITVTVDYI